MSKKIAIIATKGTLDWAYPPMILASTAAALGYDARIFCTFYGLNLLEKELDLKISPLGNPAMPMPFPVPVMVQSLPFMQSLMTYMMKQKMAKKNVVSILELRELCLEAGVKFTACQMTVDLFDKTPEHFIDGIEYAGAASFLEFAGNADITLYI